MRIERKLASIQRVIDIQPIEGANQIERASILGWGVVVKHGQFKPGDLCVFFEIDAVLPPDKDWAQFMAPVKGRVKTRKFRGCLSQGLALPTSILGYAEGGEQNVVGDDVSEVLGVKKYEPPMPDDAEIGGVFPGFVPKTDEIRLQSIPDVLGEIRTHPFFISMKMDGKSGTFIKRDGELTVCSRNWALRPSNNSYWRVAERYGLAEKLPEGFAVQGEVCGPKIQRNLMALEQDDLFVFSVYDFIQGKFLDYNDFVLFCLEHGLKTVPIEYEIDPLGEDKDFPFTQEYFLELAQGKYPGTDNDKEGIVVRPMVERTSAVLGGRLSFKVINNAYLLTEE